MICADTSFLISLYGTDINSPAAKVHLAGATTALRVHAVNDFEFRNALRLLVFRGKISEPQCRAWLANYEEDKESGTLVVAEIDANTVLRTAEIISATRTATDGNRTLDILLIAAAKIFGATEFWSFDGRQRTLAAAEGMKVGP